MLSSLFVPGWEASGFIFKGEHKIHVMYLMSQGTPLQNNMLELFSLLHYIDPYEFSDPNADGLFTNIESGNELTMEEKIARIHDILKPRYFSSLLGNAVQFIGWMLVLSSYVFVLLGC